MNVFEVRLPGRDPIQVPFCCPLPEPAFLLTNPISRETRSQSIECVNCGTTIIHLFWMPVLPKGSG